MGNKNSGGCGCGTIITIILIAGGVYLIYLFVVWLIKIVPITFAFLGFNSFFFLDCLFEIPPFNPLVVWGIIGLFIGSILGVLIAVKKLRLNSTLVLFPIIFVLVVLVILGLINAPMNHNVKTVQITKTEPFVSKNDQISFYKLISKADVRSQPLSASKKIFTLKKGDLVQLVESNFFDSNNKLWFKIKYNNTDGYIDSKLLVYSHTKNKTN